MFICLFVNVAEQILSEIYMYCVCGCACGNSFVCCLICVCCSVCIICVVCMCCVHVHVFSLCGECVVCDVWHT